jgi:hypothetical protein
MKPTFFEKFSGKIILASIAVLIACSAVSAQHITSPEEFFGHKVGADYHLINYKKAIDYWKRLEQESDKIRLFEYGRSSYGRTLIFAAVSAKENLTNVDRYKEISQRLARVRGTPDEEAKKLASEGKAIVWIDGGLHATEVAPAQHIIQLTYDLLSDDSPETQNILNEVITMLVLPNPDGMDMVAEWYESNLGTPYEISTLPFIYQKYIGHDNNRDSYMLSVAETKAINKLMNQEWCPNFFYNHHQTAPRGTTIFIQPNCEPTNPNIHPLLLRWQTLVGSAMAVAFETEGKPGVISRYMFDTWFPGYVTQVADFHNIISAFSETQLYYYATPHFYTADDFPKQFRDFPISIFHTTPWKGGWWRLRDSVEYCITASRSLLDLAAKRRKELLYAKYLMGKGTIEKYEKEPPYGWIIPKKQRDYAAMNRLLSNLIDLDLEGYQAEEAFSCDGIEYPPDTYVLPTSQPFGRFLKTLFEVQTYPDLRKYPMLWQSIVEPLKLEIPPIQTYDVLGWTLPLQMGVKSVQINTPLHINMKRIQQVEPIPGGIFGSGDYGFVVPYENSNSVIMLNRLLKSGREVFWSKGDFKVEGNIYAAGTIIVPQNKSSKTEMKALAEELSLEITKLKIKPSIDTYSLKLPRVALYQTWVVMDLDGWTFPNGGWTQLILENYEFPFAVIHDAEIKSGRLWERFDVIIVPQQPAKSIIEGHKPGTMPPQYVGGISSEGVHNLKLFVEHGGTLVTFGSACDLPIEEFDLPVKNIVKALKPEDFFASGLLLKVRFNRNHPIAFGMPEEAAGFFSNSPAFAIMPSMKEQIVPEVVGSYPSENIVCSGWMLGEKFLRNKAAVLEIPLGEGKFILLGFRVQHRAQTVGTFKLLFNSIFQSVIK